MAPRKKPKSKIRLAQAVEMAAGEAARCYLRHRSSEDQEITGQRLAVEPQPVDYVTQRAPVLRCRGLTASRPSARGVQVVLPDCEVKLFRRARARVEYRSGGIQEAGVFAVAPPRVGSGAGHISSRHAMSQNISS